MRLLSIDPALSTGWAVMDDERTDGYLSAEWGTLVTDETKAIIEFVGELPAVELMVIEEILPMLRRGSQTTWYRNHRWRVIAEYWEIPWVAIPIPTWYAYHKIKRGNKQGSIDKAISYFGEPINSDEADALNIGVYWLEKGQHNQWK